MPHVQLIFFEEIFIEFFKGKSKLYPMEYDLVSLKEDSDGQIIKSFCEFLDVYRGTLRKKSVETCSNIFSNNKSTISFKISLIN